MWSFLYALATILSMITFFGIVAWAWSRGRAKANKEAASLPFDLPDEEDQANQNQKREVGDSNE
ncbi:MAG TPA: CcoQ/FixQ family Cbb3-type cytochrome c oxidase assembly chaperone [Paenalcaligenes sp.]|nr:CcoQ/FixQ family Cbb3-type cytochrome c oxidase assembly chaperone [Paenalcaligenes sp.]HLR82942.1 CcoQ/FixQ family Cbb3-type cytochrome c oxidase assembly chaperone [Paenalcaligenes sp.]